MQSHTAERGSACWCSGDEPSVPRASNLHPVSRLPTRWLRKGHAGALDVNQAGQQLALPLLTSHPCHTRGCTGAPSMRTRARSRLIPRAKTPTPRRCGPTRPPASCNSASTNTASTRATRRWRCCKCVLAVRPRVVGRILSLHAGLVLSVWGLVGISFGASVFSEGLD